MNLQKLFELQRRLDDHIEKEHPQEPGEDRLAKKILALQVELGELANELPKVFKFWSNKKNNCEKALKEYVDGLHFILSIGLETGKYKEIEFQAVYADEHDIVMQFNVLFDKVGDFYAYRTKGNYQIVLSLFLALGKMLGFTWDQIEKAYMEKNQENHHRQEVGY